MNSVKPFILLKKIIPGIDLSENQSVSFELHELNSIVETEYGRFLHRLFLKEWELCERETMIKLFEVEHASSLALVMANEVQKHLLKDLNDRLSQLFEMHEKDMKMAANVQSSLLLASPPIVNNYDIACYYQPCASVSGDFYDFYVNKETNNLTGALLADVSGHGIAPGLLTIMAKPIFFREFADNMPLPLNTVLDTINHKLIKQMEASENYLTAVLLRFKDDIIEYTNSAHPDILLYQSSTGKTLPVTPEKGSIQGSLMGISAVAQPFASHEFRMEQEDILVLYTDCLTESTDNNREEFGEHRIGEIISGNTELTAEMIMIKLIDNFYDFTDSTTFKDDLSIIILKKK